MPIQFVCPQCRRTLSVTRRKIGSQVTCPKCAALIAVPAEPIVALADQPTQRSDQPGQTSASDWITFDDVPDLAPPTLGFPGTLPALATGAPAVDAESSDAATAQSANRVSIARASIYWQAVLVLLIALVAFGLGYWWGGVDAQRPNATPLPPAGGQQ